MRAKVRGLLECQKIKIEPKMITKITAEIPTKTFKM